MAESAFARATNNDRGEYISISFSIPTRQEAFRGRRASLASSCKERNIERPRHRRGCTLLLGLLSTLRPRTDQLELRAGTGRQHDRLVDARWREQETPRSLQPPLHVQAPQCEVLAARRPPRKGNTRRLHELAREGAEASSTPLLVPAPELHSLVTRALDTRPRRGVTVGLPVAGQRSMGFCHSRGGGSIAKASACQTGKLQRQTRASRRGLVRRPRLPITIRPGHRRLGMAKNSPSRVAKDGGGLNSCEPRVASSRPGSDLGLGSLTQRSLGLAPSSPC